MQYFSYLWNRDGVQEQKEKCIETGVFRLSHTQGTQFTKRGVAPGDYLYILHFRKKQLYVLTRLHVDKITTAEEAARLLPSDIEELGEEEEHVLAPSSPLFFDKVLSPEEVNTLLYFSRTQNDYIPFKFTEFGVPDPMSIRGVNRLLENSARTLDTVLGLSA